MEKTPENNEHQLHKNEVDRKTEHLPGEEIERMPDSDDDYRLPRSLPEPEEEGYLDENEIAARNDEADEIIDSSTDISPEEIELLDEAGMDLNSDESRSANLLDEMDEDGEPLNEGSGEDVFFDTGEDLDMPQNAVDPDSDGEDQDF